MKSRWNLLPFPFRVVEVDAAVTSFAVVMHFLARSQASFVTCLQWLAFLSDSLDLLLDGFLAASTFL